MHFSILMRSHVFESIMYSMVSIHLAAAFLFKWQNTVLDLSAWCNLKISAVYNCVDITALFLYSNKINMFVRSRLLDIGEVGGFINMQKTWNEATIQPSWPIISEGFIIRKKPIIFLWDKPGNPEQARSPYLACYLKVVIHSTWFSSSCLPILLLYMPMQYFINFSQDLHAGPRTLLPHGASFHGYPITINVSCDLPKLEITLQVSTLFFVITCFFVTN